MHGRKRGRVKTNFDQHLKTAENGMKRQEMDTKLKSPKTFFGQKKVTRNCSSCPQMIFLGKGHGQTDIQTDKHLLSDTKSCPLRRRGATKKRVAQCWLKSAVDWNLSSTHHTQICCWSFYGEHMKERWTHTQSVLCTAFKMHKKFGDWQQRSPKFLGRFCESLENAIKFSMWWRSMQRRLCTPMINNKLRIRWL